MSQSQHRCVLVVDDDGEIRALLKDKLSRSYPGLVIHEAGNGAEALQKVVRQRYELLIMDLRMPRMDGATLLQCVAETAIDFQPKHILIFSGYEDDPKSPRPIGRVTFIPKGDLGAALAQYFQTVLGAPVGGADKPPAPKFKMDVEFINPFIDSTLLVLQVMAGVTATKESIFVRAQDQISGDVSAVIAMNSSKFLGSMAIAFDTPCFLGIANSMLGEKYTSITAEIADAAGEICNQVFGNAKTSLNQLGHDIQPAIPAVVHGAGHKIRHFTNGPCLAVKFKTNYGSFTVEAVVSPK